MRSETQVEKYDELVSNLANDITQYLWEVNPEEWPGGDHIEGSITFVHPDGVLDWLCDLPIFTKMREEAEDSDNLEFEHEPELN